MSIGKTAGSFEDFLKLRLDEYVFRVDGKDMTGAFSKVFASLLKSADLLHDTKMGKKRTLYSLRHDDEDNAINNKSVCGPLDK